MKSKQKKTIDILIPSFNEEGNLPVLFQRIIDSVPKSYNTQVLFIDDGSSDGTLNAIREIVSKNKNAGFISFSKNYGHQTALKAGLDHSQGDCAISLDSDLQHPPELIPQLLKAWEEGFDIVYTKRMDNENVSWFKKWTANLFYKLLNLLSGLTMDQGAADYRLLDKKVVDALKQFQERNLFIRGMVNGIGFKKKCISYEPEKRVWGESKYKFKRMVLFALDGITSFSIKPLHIATFVGAFFSLLSGIYAIYAISIHVFTSRAVSGWTSVIVSVLFMGGVQLIVIGILGEYLGKMFLQSKNRPNYLIREESIPRKK